jgi:hypothetical protein
MDTTLWEDASSTCCEEHSLPPSCIKMCGSTVAETSETNDQVKIMHMKREVGRVVFDCVLVITVLLLTMHSSSSLSLLGAVQDEQVV